MRTRKPWNLILHPLIFLLAVVLVFEEWLWETLKKRLQRFSRTPAIATLENRIRTLPPWPALLILVMPGIVLVPFKVAALYLVSHHHPLLGLLVLLSAKVAGTAIAAYLFDLVRANARKIIWFDKLYLWIIHLLEVAKKWLHRQPTYLWVHNTITRLKSRIRLKMPLRSRIARKLQAAKAMVQQFWNPPPKAP